MLLKRTIVAASLLVPSLAYSAEPSEQVCYARVPHTCVLAQPQHVDTKMMTYWIPGCSAGVQANWDGFSGKTERSSCVASVPAGTLLVSTAEHDISLDNGNYSISKFTSGFDYHYDEEVRAI